MLHSQSGMPRMSPWWTCMLPSAASLIPPGSPRPWSERVSSSSPRWLRMRPTGAARVLRSASSTMCMETHRPSSLVTYGAASPPPSPARSSGRHWQAKAVEGADRAAMPQAATPKAAAPSKAAGQAGHVGSRSQCQGRSPRIAHRRCTSTCGLTTPRRSPEDLLAQSKRLLTKEARGLPAVVMDAKRASTPLMLHLISRVSSTPPRVGKRPTPCVSAIS
jgi:hypothetical protein